MPLDREPEPDPITVAVHPSLRGSIERLARGRTLVLGFFTSTCCGGAVVGDLRVAWEGAKPSVGYRHLSPIEGVEVVADERLLDILSSALPELRPGGPLHRGSLTLRLGRPERWLEFLGARQRPAWR